jgi:hypothetical protein
MCLLLSINTKHRTNCGRIVFSNDQAEEDLALMQLIRHLLYDARRQRTRPFDIGPSARGSGARSSGLSLQRFEQAGLFSGRREAGRGGPSNALRSCTVRKSTPTFVNFAES